MALVNCFIYASAISFDYYVVVVVVVVEAGDLPIILRGEMNHNTRDTVIKNSKRFFFSLLVF